ncbi:MAG: hypothetical protein V1672_01245 [Candidatus Diapherotrites archaeon]
MKSRPLLFAFVAIFIIFAMQSVNAGTPVYDMNALSVYESGTDTLGDGTPVCVDLVINTGSGVECTGNLEIGSTYQFEVGVNNTSTSRDGTPNSFQFQLSSGIGDVLGNLPPLGNAGCVLNADWTPADAGATIMGLPGTPCTIVKSTGEIFWFIITIDQDAGNETANFYVTDGSITDTSDTITFNIIAPNNPPTLDITVPDVGGTWATSPQDINFTITDADCPDDTCDLNMGLWYSASKGAYTTEINKNLTIATPTDVNCGNDYDFRDGSNCSYRWDISAVPDGTYFIDAQLYDGTDLNYDSSNTSFIINQPPVITIGTHDGNVLHDRNVLFHATCDNAGDNFSVFVCKKDPGEDAGFVLCYAGTNKWCSSTAGTDTTPDCNVTAACGSLVDNQFAYVTCCDDSAKCDVTNYFTTTFRISDEIVFFPNAPLFDANTYSPIDDTSKTNCELDYFDINGIKNFCDDALIDDASMEVFANGASVCTDTLGDMEIGGRVTYGYSCSATMNIDDYDWHIDVNAPNTANTEGNTTLNTGGDRNYVVKNDEFSYDHWEPPNNATYENLTLIDFNVFGLANSCGTVITDARVSFWDYTETWEICQDSSGTADGNYLCSLESGTAPLDEITETIYLSITKTDYDDSNSATRTLNLLLEDLTFAMSYPTSGCSDQNGCRGGGCGPACTYCAFYSEGLDQNEVNCSGQTSVTPFYAYDNQSSPSTNQTWTMDLNANLAETGLWHKVSTGSGGYEAVCTDSAPPDTTHCVYVMTTTPVEIGTGITPAGDKNAWAWADFEGAVVGTIDRNVTSTSSAT